LGPQVRIAENPKWETAYSFWLETHQGQDINAFLKEHPEYRKDFAPTKGTPEPGAVDAAIANMDANEAYWQAKRNAADTLDSIALCEGSVDATTAWLCMKQQMGN
jgi:hypothetical protein